MVRPLIVEDKRDTIAVVPSALCLQRIDPHTAVLRSREHSLVCLQCDK